MSSARYRWILAHDEPPLTGYDQDLWVDRLHHNEDDPEVLTMMLSTVEAWLRRRGCDHMIGQTFPDDFGPLRDCSLAAGPRRSGHDEWLAEDQVDIERVPRPGGLTIVSVPPHPMYQASAPSFVVPVFSVAGRRPMVLADV